MSDVIDLLRKLIAFDTTSSKPNRGCIDFMRDYLDGFGVKSQIVAGEESGKACLWATIGDAAGRGIVLSGHSDTVPVEGQAWRSDPFTLTERDGKLYGRGSCDMKGFIACVLALVPELTKSQLRKPIHLAFTHDEESDMSGAISLTNFLRHNNILPEWVWIGEPTEHKIIDSHKGVAAFRTRITGVPAHSGKPDLGLSAIELGTDFLAILRAVGEEKRGKPFPQSRFDPPYTTINAGIVSGGTAENIIAEHFDLLWQMRAHPGDEAEGVLQSIDSRAAAKLQPRFQAFSATHPGIGCTTCTCYNILPLLPTPDNPGQKLLARHTGRTQTEAVSFATEAGFFQSLGAPVVICGPGSIDQAHKADEYVARSELDACLTLLRSAFMG